MGWREWAGRNTAIATLAAVGVLVLALVVVLVQAGVFAGSPRIVEELAYWDTNDQRLFPAPRDSIPPIEAPSGGEGVAAYIHTCGECAPDEWFGYLERFTPEGKRLMELEREDPDSDEVLGIMMTTDVDDLREVRALEASRWVRVSENGQGLIQSMRARECPDGSAPRRCEP